MSTSNGMEATRETLHQTGEKIAETTRGAAAYGRRRAGEALEAAEGAARSAGRYARENPTQAILLGLGGLLLASLLFRRR